jgi:transposase-like protein
MFICKHCNTEKPKTDFYDSSKSKCKECIKSAVRLHREQNIDRIREYDKARSNQPHRVEARKEYTKTEAGKQAKKRAMDAYHKRYPMKYATHVIAGNAIRDGKLIQASECSVCKSTEKIEGHHDDYTKPLDVRWLCESCHKKWHRHNKPIYQ